jgi:hypothetical protein
MTSGVEFHPLFLQVNLLRNGFLNPDNSSIGPQLAQWASQLLALVPVDDDAAIMEVILLAFDLISFPFLYQFLWTVFQPEQILFLCDNWSDLMYCAKKEFVRFCGVLVILLKDGMIEMPTSPFLKVLVSFLERPDETTEISPIEVLSTTSEVETGQGVF